MSNSSVPFDYGLFWHAMISLLGREPDVSHRFGWDGTYTFRYEPKNDEEKKKFAASVGALQEWLSIFRLSIFRSRCEYGRLLNPQKGEENKDFLYICIAFTPLREKK